MKKFFLSSLIIALGVVVGSCSQEEINTEFSVTTQPVQVIPAKAISCYSYKITGIGETPQQDINEAYFSIPMFSIWRADSRKQLIISTIRVTYSIPTTTGSQKTTEQSCVFAGDNLKSLSSAWWGNGKSEAIIDVGAGTSANPFQTDCQAKCGGIDTKVSNYYVSGLIEIFGLERNTESGEETAIKLQGYVNIQSL